MIILSNLQLKIQICYTLLNVQGFAGAAGPGVEDTNMNTWGISHTPEWFLWNFNIGRKYTTWFHIGDHVYKLQC